ncbi:unnamed protein product [Effrenium voratum]|uniref:Uncharacterized protein n=1 Tax=Effrenium voratum TaxID=2562239 RepID=A0AA36JSS9_9DINO|nr:unnamed protein product [Effrenium voratum]
MLSDGSECRSLETRVRINRAESLERHSEMEIMLSEVTTVQKSMKTVLHHLEDRLEKVHCIAAKALELARLAVNESSEERGHNHSLAMSEALRMFHRQTDDLAKAQSAMEGARLEAEEALQLRWSRGPVDRYIGQEVMDRLQEVQADALRLSSREACAAAEEMHVELQQIGEAVQSISCEHRELKEEAAIQMRCQHRALSRDIAALERRLSSQTRLAEAAGALLATYD